MTVLKLANTARVTVGAYTQVRRRKIGLMPSTYSLPQANAGLFATVHSRPPHPLTCWGCELARTKPMDHASTADKGSGCGPNKQAF